MRSKKLLAGLLVGVMIVCLFFSGCIGSIEMDVKSYYDPERNLLEVKQFNLAPINKENPLLEKELLFMVKEQLVQKGYIYDEENPDFLVAINFYCGPFQYYVPPTTLYFPRYTPGETYSGWIGSEYFHGSSLGQWKSEPYIIGGYTKTAYYRNLQIYFVDYNKLLQSGEVEVIWQGQVESSGSNSDIRIIAPYAIGELLDEFPIKTGKPNKRTITRTPQK